ncbi:SCP2 sterol-binding domain-containing protein [bacterium]|nr:SCP2 sterol-binding domain-containing protein [bacterium]
MNKIENHPTVLTIRQKPVSEGCRSLSAATVRQMLLEAGADDVGFVSIDRAEIDDQRATIHEVFPTARTLVSFVVKMNREPIRSTARSTANLEFHQSIDEVNEISREVVSRLEAVGVAALNPAGGFPMEMSQFPLKMWTVSHKPVAVAAGLGRMGIHRNVIHPRFGNFILLGTIVLGVDLDEESAPIDYNPCLECKLCVSACPVGAIKPDGQFDPSACLTHNYREFMSGFTDWVGQVADSKDAHDYGRRVTDSETASMWQSLSFGANYKAAYCLAVCPAGEDVITPFLTDRGQFQQQVLKPLQQKKETVYVVANSDAETYVAKRFPHKTTKRVGGVRPNSIDGFLFGLPIVFQAEQSKDLDAVYHFTFKGSSAAQATVTIRNKRVSVETGLHGKANCAVTADADTWVGFLRKERNIVWAILRRKVLVRGPLSLLTAFGRCFPS